jgi:hypothetical protein
MNDAVPVSQLTLYSLAIGSQNCHYRKSICLSEIGNLVRILVVKLCLITVLL